MCWELSSRVYQRQGQWLLRIKLYFEMGKYKYFKSLDNKDRNKVLDILLKDLKVLTQGNKGLIKDLSYLLIVDNTRQIKPIYQYANYGRKNMMVEIKEIITIVLWKNPSPALDYNFRSLISNQILP